MDQDNIIVVGHTRYKALKSLNKTKAFVIKRDFEKGKAMAYRIMDNRSGQETTWDNKLLVSELNILKDSNLDLDLTGFDFKELDDLLKETEDSIKGLTDEDLVPAIPEEPITKKGDLWQLGNHRLLCGDSTNEDDYKKLMNGAKADMVFTDPPYGLNYKYNSYIDVEGHEYLEFCDKWFPLLQKHTDFIFTLFSEEFGFFGSVCLLLIYALVIYRIFVIGNNSKSNFAKLYCFSFATAFFFYVTVNMSMVLGLLPIVGAPLPIISYGGSSMLATMIGFSVVMSAKIYQRQAIS